MKMGKSKVSNKSKSQQEIEVKEEPAETKNTPKETKRKIPKRKKKPVVVPKFMKTVRMTKKTLDEALKVLEEEETKVPDHSRDCFKPSWHYSDSEYTEFALMTEQRFLFEMQKCIDREDWVSFTKYMLNFTSENINNYVQQIQFKLAVVGLTYDPVAREHNLLQELITNVQESALGWKNDTFCPEEAVRKIFAIL